MTYHKVCDILFIVRDTKLKFPREPEEREPKWKN
ncbi:hypothetical protein [Enterocloster phage PMBT24]|uniref:Uncharacterized protein n=1 Tax=Enterocloster phage PMBT24 TaxID=3025413 RepID=A0AAT9TRV3_9CAUD|nr:hypothetical protein [Enterocloster phage PMBT24]